MNVRLLNGQTKLAVNVIVKNEKDGKVRASVLGLPEYSVVGSDRNAAISELDKLIAENLSGNEVISLEIEIPKREHPWRKFAGVYKDSDLFDSVLKTIEANRLKLNSPMSNDREEERIA